MVCKTCGNDLQGNEYNCPFCGAAVDYTEAVEQAGLTLSDIDHFVLHQANSRIIQSVAKRLGQPVDKFPMNLQECGNISAASIPILLDSLNKNGMIRKKEHIVLAGFGAGLTWGAAVIQW